MVTKANEAINWLFFLIEGNLINDVNQSLLRNSLLAPGRKCNAARDATRPSIAKQVCLYYKHWASLKGCKSLRLPIAFCSSS